MNKLKTMIMAGAALFGAAQAWGETWSQMTLTYVSTTGGCFASDQNGDKLLDNDASTKWGSGFTGDGNHWVEFTASAGVPERLELVTAADTATFVGRNWTGWTLYGLEGSTWTAIKAWSGQSLSVTAGATATYTFDNSKAYSKYKIVVNATASGYGAGTQQMADLKLYTDTSRTPETVEVSDWATLKANLEAGNSVKLTQNITSSTPWISKTTGSVALDLNGCTITQTDDGSSAMYLVYDSEGTVKLTIKDSASGGAIVGNSTKATTAGMGGGGFYLLKSGSSLALDSGTLKNFRLNGSSSTLNGGCIYVNSGCSFTMNGGTISGCTTTGSGGAIYNNAGTVTMNGGTIMNNTATSSGGAIANCGTLVINGGELANNSAQWGGALYNSGTATLYGGQFVDNVAQGSSSANGGFGYGGTDSKTYIYGGFYSGNMVKDFANAHFYIGYGYQQNGYLYGGVFADADPTSSEQCKGCIGKQSSYEPTLIGANYVVGQSVAYDSNNQLTAGTYTFCPTNAEYEAAGVSVSEKKYLAVNESVSPTTWTITNYNVEKDSTSTYKPTQIVNGGFDARPFEAYKYGGTVYTSYPGGGSNGSYWQEVYPNGVDAGWNTTETQILGGNLFEYLSGPVWGITWSNGGFIEMNAYNSAVLFQDLTTYGGDVIRWTLKHAARPDYGGNPQKMKVEIGAPQTNASGIVAAVGVNANVDSKVRSETKAVYEPSGVTNPSGATYGYANTSELSNLWAYRGSTGQDAWLDARGVYVIPDDQSVTRFAFIATSDTEISGGNLLDDLTFSTLIGNLKALVNDDGSVTITGYWGDSDTSKSLMIKIGDAEAESVSMASVVNTNFAITVSSDKIGSANSLEVYHQDYESAKRTVTIGYAVTLNLNADDAKCAKLETYQRGVVTVLPIPTRTGYSFKGWFENAELTGTAVAQIEATATGAKTFYAKWQGSLIQVGDDAWAWVTNGLCEITGTTATWDFTTTANPLDSYSRAITNIVVCDGVTELGAYTFYKFYYATNITFAASVTNLCAGALFRCLSFENVTFEGTLPNMEDDNALVIHAGIKMEGGKPVVYAVPNVTVNGQSLILKGKDKLTDAEWQTVTAGEEENYHFFKFVAE